MASKKSSREIILTALLKQYGYKPKSVWYVSGFQFLPEVGWWVEMENGQSSYLGKSYEVSKANIENNKLLLKMD